MVTKLSGVTSTGIMILTNMQIIYLGTVIATIALGFRSICRFSFLGECDLH